MTGYLEHLGGIRLKSGLHSFDILLNVYNIYTFNKMSKESLFMSKTEDVSLFSNCVVNFTGNPAF